MTSYNDLDIYKKSFELAGLIHELSMKLPKTEQFELGSQIRRSAQSIRSNIIEGYGRKEYKAEFVRFLIISFASCLETNDHLVMLKRIYPTIPEVTNLISQYQILGKMLNNYIKYVRKNWKTQ